MSLKLEQVATTEDFEINDKVIVEKEGKIIREGFFFGAYDESNFRVCEQKWVRPKNLKEELKAIIPIYGIIKRLTPLGMKPYGKDFNLQEVSAYRLIQENSPKQKTR